MTEEILFRCSSIGNLLVEGADAKISETQLKRIDELMFEMENGVNEKGNKVKWTPTKAEELQRLIDKRDAPPQLSATAKKEVEKVWLMLEKGFYKELGNKYILKGLLNEEDGIDLISELDGEFYVKNTERITKGNLTGECDIIHIYNSFEELPQWRKDIDDGTTKFPLKVIKDIKNNYDAMTFMNAILEMIYEGQGRSYLYLYDADEFHLEFVLTDLPEHQLESEFWKIKNKYGIIDMDTPEAQPLFDQIRRNFIYSDNPAYTLAERRKTFVIKRDKSWEDKLHEKLKLAVEYYKTITLNQIR